MTKLFLLGFLVYGLIFASLATLNGGLLALTIPLLIYLGAGFLRQPETLRLKVSRSLSTDHVFPGEPVTVKLTLTNEGTWLDEVLLEDLLPNSLIQVDGQVSVMTSLPPGGTVQLVYRVQGKRGIYHFSAVRVTAGGHLSLFKKRTRLPAPGQFLVLPEVVRLQRVEIRPRQTRVYSGVIPARQGGPGVEFFGVREYQPGDPLRWINSRASARHAQTTFINEFEQERVADVGLILDARQQSDVPSSEGSLFEYSIQATTALADAFLNAGNRVGLFIYGRALNWTFPGYGKIQRERILWALAQAKPGAGHVFEKLEHLPTRLFPARSQLVLVSPLLPHDPDELIKLRARGYRLLVVSPDPIAFEQKERSKEREIVLATRIARLERKVLLGKLRQADIRVLDWPVETPFPQAAHAALSRFQRL